MKIHGRKNISHAKRSSGMPAARGNQRLNNLFLLGGAALSGDVEIHQGIFLAGGLLTAGIGAASMIPASDKTPDDLIRQADMALYQAKTNGRNRTELGDETTTL